MDIRALSVYRALELKQVDVPHSLWPGTQRSVYNFAIQNYDFSTRLSTTMAIGFWKAGFSLRVHDHDSNEALTLTACLTGFRIDSLESFRFIHFLVQNGLPCSFELPYLPSVVFYLALI